MTNFILIDPDLWARTRAGARAGRGFRYQDAVCAALAVDSWAGTSVWTAVVPEGLDDVTLHGSGLEIRAQIKSRHDPRGEFTLKEVAEYLAKMNLPLQGDHPNELKFSLVLERPVRELEPSGWDATLAQTGQALSALENTLSMACAPRPVDVPAVFERLHIVVAPDPLGAVPAILAHMSGLEPAAGRLVGQMLREAAGRAADDNYAQRPGDPASLGATAVQALIDDVHRIVDPLGRLDLADELCDAANFHEPLTSADFYSGVNVMPGHVGAGLVFERPTETTDVLQALETSRTALVAGPSGAGKSALTWLAAYHSRHAVRWYRVRQLADPDVPRLIQFARLLDAGPTRPVGFVVDDVGRAGAAGWDRLMTEVHAIAGLLILGSVREEDVFLLDSAKKTPVIRPILDESLAERLWSALSSEGQVVFSHWVEPFEQSRGLLLEYTHLLTEGRRLEQTLAEQVRRRLAEDRFDELQLLGRIVFPGRYGATIEGRVLRDRLGWNGPRMAKALARLVEEHAVREGVDGVLGGLHEIRSAYLDDATRACLDEPASESVTESAWVVSAPSLPTFIARVLRAHPGQQSALIGALAARVMSGEVLALGPILHGLGLATADIVAARWLEICRRLEVEDRFSSLLFMLSATGAIDGDLPLFVKLRAAVSTFAETKVLDLRVAFLDRLYDVSKLNFQAIDLESYHRLQAALMPLRGCEAAPRLDMSLDRDLSSAPLIPLLELIRTTTEIKPDEAARLVDLAGGSQSLLARLPDELAWITLPHLIEAEGDDTERELTVEAYVRVISETVQTDLHGDVVRLCELMLAAAPQARRAVSDSLLPDGTPLMVGGSSVNSKRIPRGNLPGPAQIAWNRAQARAIDRLVGAPQETGRTASLASLIGELNQRLDEAANIYLRMELPKERWRLLVNIGAMLRDFVPPPRVDEAMSDPLDPGSYDSSDRMHAFAADLQRLVTELADDEGDNMNARAMRVADLAATARKLADPEIWRMISAPPTQAMSDLAERLEDVRAIYGHIANDPAQRQRWATHFSTTSRRHSALPKAATQARTHAEQALAARKTAYEAAFAEAGLVVHVCARAPAKDEGYAWPYAYFACLLEASSIQEWLSVVERFFEVCQKLEDTQRMSCAPLIRSQVPPIALVRIGGVLLPDTDFTKDWRAQLPWPIVESPLLVRVTEALNDITAVSAMLQDKGADLNPLETIQVESHLRRINDAMVWFGEAFAVDPSVANATAGQMLLSCFQRLEREFDRPPPEESLAVEFGRTLNNDLTELTAQLTGLRIALMEHALGLEAWSDLADAVEEAPAG
ncbi:hypothetical protein [Parvibaculum sp.]|uniref:hypothetical protein n=1 Tax=Parvibaculum sp. TaxID=2024848 RepID=UPI001DD78AC6|nr:hypothetical protein [Parvibaculum sp.]MBX3488722.1 hypothetical protein [Parvibaculum sp.]MCW5727396.1 hypothetical protein [Parvibaculum sp.]